MLGGDASVRQGWKSAAYRGRADNAEPFSFDVREAGGRIVADLSPCLRAIYSLRHTSPDATAWRFHITVCALIAEVCVALARRHGIHKVALGGGVFLNRLVIERVVPMLERAALTVYRSREVSPGDGGLALGQTYAGLWMAQGPKK
jgi:hydrogenase maturation protein HypF